MTRARLVAFGVMIVLLSTVGGCGRRRQGDVTTLRAIMRRTALSSARVEYEEDRANDRVGVNALLEDSFRYNALLSVNGAPALEEIVNDDALADRVLAADAYKVLGTKNAQAGAIAANGQWVLDDQGAPRWLVNTPDKLQTGDDPIYDALHLFRYLDDAIGASSFVHKYNRDSLDYNPKDDPFPKPDPGSSVTRFDLDPPPMPDQGSASGASSAFQQFPGAAQFRQLSIYVRDGRIIEVRERIEVRPKLLTKLQRLLAAGKDSPRTADAALAALNAARVRRGDQPVRTRRMTMRLTAGGAAHATLPAATTAGDLSMFVFRGKPPTASATVTKAAG
jgi:hypothetical protein